MSTPARLGMGVAAVLAIVVLGAAALNVGGSGPDVGAAPTPASSPSAHPGTPEPAPSASPTERIAALPRNGSAPCGPGLPERCNEAGTYRLPGAAWPATIAFDLPAGWWTYTPASDHEGVLVEVADAASGSGWGVTFMTVGDVSVDPCDRDAGRVARGETATVEMLVAAMRSWPDFEVSTATPIEVDGYAGQLVEVTSTRTSSDCGDGTIWTTKRGTPIDGYPMIGDAEEPRPGQFHILDIDGELLITRTTDFADASPFELGQGIEPDPDRHAADQVELRRIVESIRITP